MFLCPVVRTAPQASQEFVQTVVGLDAMSQGAFPVDLVMVSSPFPMAHEVTAFFEVGDDSLDGAFGDTDLQ